jgi:hypothetical protein
MMEASHAQGPNVKRLFAAVSVKHPMTDDINSIGASDRG